ncbi:Flp pilus assembly complex ATPase component TadA [Candidatus Woesearchaeota archaeon]|nr:Flp pilus assembly complex ATPase component TadA [Candidatus Woesearchaeota archaeon]
MRRRGEEPVATKKHSHEHRSTAKRPVRRAGKNRAGKPKHRSSRHSVAKAPAKRPVRHAGKKRAMKTAAGKPAKKQARAQAPEKKAVVIDRYEFKSGDIPITITVQRVTGEFVPIYNVEISNISRTTEYILEKIRQELIKRVSLGLVDLADIKKATVVEDKFKEYIVLLIDKYFPDANDSTKGFLKTYLIAKALGLGSIEILMNDALLEEIVVNQADQPIWVYQKKHGWLKTNITMRDEDQTKHYAAIIGRKVGRQITVLEPLLDAHLNEGDRVNATISPISTAGNTITIRKFSRDPWTITKFIRSKTISVEAAALIWLAMQYEMSAIIAGGTASGKTSALNVLANFFPPNQRIISIEDTREIRLPSFLHWVPMNTRLPNAEGKGEVSMGDLLVNSLRMRPDRILVGEVRRQREAETLFEAIHTGHSVYATFHANNAAETVERLTNPPINVPKIMLPAISLIIVQFRNRRTGTRRTFQIAEILPGSEPNVLMQYDNKLDRLVKKNKSRQLYANLKLYTGMTDHDIQEDLHEKMAILDYLEKLDITSVDGVGRVIAEYYTNKELLLQHVKSGKQLTN